MPVALFTTRTRNAQFSLCPEATPNRQARARVRQLLRRVRVLGRLRQHLLRFQVSHTPPTLVQCTTFHRHILSFFPFFFYGRAMHCSFALDVSLSLLGVVGGPRSLRARSS